MRPSICISVLLVSAMLFLWNGCASQHAENDVAVATSNPPPTFDGKPANIVLINNSTEPFRGIFLAPSDTHTPETNFLESESLAVGKSVEISGLPPGAWDIHIEDRMGRSRIYRSQSLAADEAYSLIIDAYGWE